MSYPGTDLKFKVTAIGRGFNMNIDVAGGMDDNTEVSLMTEQDADDMMSRILGGS